MIVRQSGRTVHSVWSFIARELPYALEPTPSIPVDFAPGVTTSPSSIHMDERPKSLPPVPQSEVAPPPVAYGGYREPFTFNSVTSILNSLAPQEAPKTYQLYDTPIPIARPPVQKSFERISGTGSISGRGSVSLSGHYNPTPLYERFARGGREVSVPARSTPSPPPVTSPVRPRRKEGDFVPWHAMDQHDLRRARTREPEIRATTPERDLSQTQSLPERSLSRPPRILPGTLPNPNIHRSLRRP
ncbi:hypothetical protein FRC07_015004 [Ceratobasidium sp. 392]|nr:hypothetical protein FRC07_015004 [Ceratobasidium sp. 392]